MEGDTAALQARVEELLLEVQRTNAEKATAESSCAVAGALLAAETKRRVDAERTVNELEEEAKAELVHKLQILEATDTQSTASILRGSSSGRGVLKALSRVEKLLGLEVSEVDSDSASWGWLVARLGSVGDSIGRNDPRGKTSPSKAGGMTPHAQPGPRVLTGSPVLGYQLPVLHDGELTKLETAGLHAAGALIGIFDDEGESRYFRLTPDALEYFSSKGSAGEGAHIKGVFPLSDVKQVSVVLRQDDDDPTETNTQAKVDGATLCELSIEMQPWYRVADRV